MWTAVPPAKSIAASLLAIQPPVSAVPPSNENTQCATGKYTNVTHRPANSSHAAELDAVGDRTGDQRDGDDREHQLERDEHRGRHREHQRDEGLLHLFDGLNTRGRGDRLDLGQRRYRR